MPLLRRVLIHSMQGRRVQPGNGNPLSSIACVDFDKDTVDVEWKVASAETILCCNRRMDGRGWSGGIWAEGALSQVQKSAEGWLDGTKGLHVCYIGGGCWLACRVFSARRISVLWTMVKLPKRFKSSWTHLSNDKEGQLWMGDCFYGEHANVNTVGW